MFPQLSDSDKINYPALEQEILEFWEQAGIFEKSVESRPADKVWTFYEGPPTVNGAPGIHHVLSRTLKDTFCRFKTMQGYRVHRKAGWDTHGLPVEIELEKKLGLKEKGEIETKIGVAEFNRQAKELVYSHINKPGGWRELTERMGYWVNMDDPYITCTNNYIESIWWALKTLFEKGLIYRGFKVTPQCPHCETPLSSHELAQGYAVVRDPSLFVKIAISPGQKTGHGIEIPEGAKFLVWTTTPWTLISNVALAVGPEIEYTMARNPETDETYVFATALRAKLDKEHEWIIEAEFKGADIERVRYERLFDYAPVDKDAFYVTLANFVSTEDGTGIVHVAPAFGQDDYEVSREYDLPVLQPVTPGGRFTDQAGPFSNRMVKTVTFDNVAEEGADKDIVINLKERELVFRYSKDYEHSYPHCWRCDNPLIYFARDSWYVRTADFSDKMIAANKTIRWQTEEIGSGRFGNWLEDNKDWALSRDRYWGTPLPIWVNEDDPADIFAIGSIEELKQGEIEANGEVVPVSQVEEEIDLHKPFVDRVVFRREGKTYRRTSELIDVWFDSGSMPFAQWHYPFENKDLFERHFPADFICEGVDQTRGWFYTLHAIGTGIFDSTAYRSVLVNDMVLDDKGKKMSKRVGNIVNPFDVLKKYGADATRWYMITASPPWTPMSFREDDLRNVVISDFFRALTNTYSFFALYANIDGFTYQEDPVPFGRRAELDRWILSVLNTTVQKYTEYLEGMDPSRAMRLVQEFTVEHLSNWYVRRNRRRFWKGEMSEDKLAAYQTLYECLNGVAKLMAPLAPFLAEKLFLALNQTAGREEAESVHLTYIPVPNENYIDEGLERRMERAQKAITLARNLREKSGLKVRQPLRRILIAVSDTEEQKDYQLVEDIIRDELNVKAVEYVGADENSDIVKKKAKPNFKAIGPRFGKDAKQVAAAIATLTGEQIQQLQAEGTITLAGQNDSFEIHAGDIDIVHEDIEGWLVAAEGPVTVALDTEIDDALHAEGLAREFVSRIQKIRKDSGMEVTDRIRLRYSADADLVRAIEAQTDYIARETLTVELLYDAETNGTKASADDTLEGMEYSVVLERVEMAAS